MQEAFLAIITVLACGYALFTKQMRVVFGLFVLTISFVIMVPNLIQKWSDFFGALAMIIFALGILILVYQKKQTKNE